MNSADNLPHRTRAAAQDRQRAIFRILATEPEQPFTLDEIYRALRPRQTKAEVKSAISCLRTRGLVRIATPGDSHTVATTYRLAELGLMEAGRS